MKTCKYCGGEVIDTAKKCKHCGKWLNKESETTQIKNIQKMNTEIKTCPHCGKTVLPTVKKCKYCGSWINSENKKNIASKKNFSQNSETNNKNNIDIILKIISFSLLITAIIISLTNVINSNKKISSTYKPNIHLCLSTDYIRYL